MDDKTLKIISNALDKTLNHFTNDQNCIYQNEKERLKFKHTSRDELNKWKKKNTCIVDKCNNKSIEKSHTIQKSASIKLISENGHVLTPKLNPDNGRIELFSVGVNEASTFPGFCKEHEKLFEGFENIKDFNDGLHLGLQLYRTVCREIVICNNRIKSIKYLADNYRQFRDNRIKEIFFDVVGTDFIEDNNIYLENFKLNYKDERLRLVEEHIKNQESYLHDFLNVFRFAILNDLKKNKFQKTVYKAIHLDFVVPVALAGRGNFFIKTMRKIKSIDLIINVLPLNCKTLIFASTLKKFTNEFDHYMKQFFYPLKAVSMIENWMIHGSDHWFIKPSEWHKLDDWLQKEILNEIANTSYNIGHDCSFSIFKDIRTDIIKIFDNIIGPKQIHITNYFETERNKLNVKRMNLTP